MLDENDALPHGFGKGSLFLSTTAVNSANRVAFDLNGFNQTINGLFSGSATVTNVIFNGSNNVISTLTIGDNDASGTWGGIIEDADATFASASSGKMAITKIGGGVQVFTNVNTYTGATTISNGVLQLTVTGSINGSTNINIKGGTFDVSGVTYTVPAVQTINVAGGTWSINSASSPNSSVNMTNGTLKVPTLALVISTPNLAASTINLSGSGTTNFIQAINVPSVDAYPKTNLIATYTTLNGDATTLKALLPAGGFPAFAGYISNDVVNKQILLVLTNGPVTPSLTWMGAVGGVLNSTWDFVASDWTNKPAHTAASYSDGALVTFDDTGLTNVINLVTTNYPAGVTVNNSTLNYKFIGTGAIVGTNGITKLGTGKLTLDESGPDLYNGLSIGGGIVQIGINDANGSPGTNAIGDNGTLVFNRNNSVLNISNSISGSGSLLVSNTASTTTILSGGSSFSGDAYVVSGITLAPANANALSSTNGTLTIPTGTTLDVSGLGIGANTLGVKKVVSVSGAGVDGTSGAIVNNTITNQQNALLRVALAGDTTVGGSGRFDIRGTGAALNTGGNAYNLTKKGAGQFSIVGTAVEGSLSNIDVQAGTLSLETTTSGAGTNGTLTVENGATLQIFNLTGTALSRKPLVWLDGNGTVATLNIASGSNNIVGAPTVVSNQVVLNMVNNTKLSMTNVVSGPGSLTKNGTNSTLTLSGANTYSGGTTINNGTLVLSGINNSGGSLTENFDGAATTAAIVGGSGTNAGPVDIEATLWPGVTGSPATFGGGNGNPYSGNTSGSFVFNDSGSGTTKAAFSLNTATTVGSGVNDLVVVNGDFYGNAALVRINPLTPLTVGSPYTILTYTGSRILPSFNSGVDVVDALQPSRYNFTLNYSTPNEVHLTVTTGAGSLVWNNAASTGIWSTNALDANWTNAASAANDQFFQLDSVTFDDSIGGGVTTVNLNTTNLIPGSVTINSGTNYTFAGNGNISGATGLTKNGTGTLTISNANTFTGTLTVQGGTLAANVNNALGAGAVHVYGGTLQANGINASVTAVLITNGTARVSTNLSLGIIAVPVYVTNSGTFDVGGNTVNEGIVFTNANGDGTVKQFFVSGWGVNSNGALINSGPVHQQNAFQNITLMGDTAFGGPGFAQDAANSGRWDVRGATNIIPSLSTGGQPYNLYKVGQNQVSLVGTIVDSALGNIDIQGGEFGVETTTSPTLGDPTKTITVEMGTSFELFNFAGPLNKKIVAFGGQMLNNSNRANIWFNSNSGGTNNVLIGTVVVTNGIVAVGGAAAGTLSNVVSGNGGLLICGPVTLASANTYSGNTIISNNGTLFLTNVATINTSPNLNVLGGTVNVSERTDGTLTLSGSQTLAGFGTLDGSLSAPSGTTVTVGTNGAVGRLNVTNNVTLAGTLNMDLNKAAATNDVLLAGVQINYGGALVLSTNLSGALLVSGDSFKLFNATTYGGSFASISPASPNNDPALAWDTSQLNSSGILGVTTSGPGVFTQPPTMTSISFSGNNITASVTNAQAGDGYYLLTTTNLNSPWKVISTNIPASVGANGSFTFIGTNVVTSGDQQQFYILVSTNSINNIP